MFGLFKRTKIEKWEIELLRSTIIGLPDSYSKLLDSIDEGLFRNVSIGVSDIPNYVAFGFNFDIYKKYSNEKEGNYKLMGMKVFDNTSASFLPYEIYISSGVINGYSFGNGKKRNIDPNKIDISKMTKKSLDTSDYGRIEHMFDEDEKSTFSPSDVYPVIIDNKEYFHLKDLEDGDFIGVDHKKVIYKITHDPMEIVEINKNIIEVLS